MSATNPDHSRDSALLRTSDSDWAYKKQVNRLREISRQLALAYNRIQDYGKVMRQCTEQLFGEVAPVDSKVSPDVRHALLESLTVIWNNNLSTSAAFCDWSKDELARCRDSVIAANQTVMTTNPTLAWKLPQLVQLTSDLRAGHPIQPLPVPAPFVPPPVAVAGIPQSIRLPAGETADKTSFKTAGQPVVKAVDQPSAKAANQPNVKAVGQPNVKTVDQSIVKATGKLVVKAADQPIPKAANRPSVKTVSQPVVKATYQPNVEAEAANPTASRTPDVGGCLPGGKVPFRLPCPAPPSIPLTTGAWRGSELNASPAVAPSRKRKAKAQHGRHMEPKSEDMKHQDFADIMARLNRLESHMTQEMATMRRDIATIPRTAQRASPEGPRK